jgi:hypothetical protein
MDDLPPAAGEGPNYARNEDSTCPVSEYSMTL